MSKIVMDSEGNAFYSRLEESQCKIIQTEKNYEEVILTYEKIPFAIDQGELLRVFLIQNQGKFQILLMGHHLVGDGKSLVLFMEGVLRRMAGELYPFEALQLLIKTTLPRSSRLPFATRLLTKKMSKIWSKNKVVFGFCDYYDLQAAYCKNDKVCCSTEVQLWHNKSRKAEFKSALRRVCGQRLHFYSSSYFLYRSGDRSCHNRERYEFYLSYDG